MIQSVFEAIKQPWPWYVAGPMIALVYFSLIISGRKLGISSNLKTMCTILGAGKKYQFFNIDWKAYSWNLLFVLGLIIGGAIAQLYLKNDLPIDLNENTIQDLKELGISNFNNTIPEDLFNWQNLLTFRGFIFFIVGGFLIGFGTRYADGCTSGHAITGLANLQIPSVIAVIGFFIGGLIATHLLFPLIF
ncbi:YeeE/YedE family protein [Chondrinema litorale]|uniref:YeeE/YedE family protein n=1 Tax=Chondrinema litorale TaxID=2994555 RepID=UPI00254351AA|nr:YeeE/YedE thiosulfate transporter family protein [Chondrinema litorale]UZR95992.1 YeeE/YedE thiosulfate transporter family protein [Chondrinema litorale]